MREFHQFPIRYFSSVTLNVHDVTTMVHFYTQTLGFELIEQTPDQTKLGFQDHTIVILNHDQPYRLETQRTQGLYHVAFLVPNEQTFTQFLRYITEQDIPIQGFANHGVSYAVYFSDPEGNGIEVYVDRPVHLWPKAQGKLSMVTDPLDIRSLFSTFKGARSLSKQTILGHVHLHVNNLDELTRFYHEHFGYEVTQHYGTQARFLSDGGYHHHLGVNTWLGVSNPKKNLQTTGLVALHILTSKVSTMIDPIGITIYTKNV